MLFRLECKKIIRSAAFIIYCILCVLFITSQYFSDVSMSEDVGFTYDEYNDYKISNDHDLIMEGALNSLSSEYTSNHYVCYPLGFYKAVHLSDRKQEKIKEYLKEMTGTDDAEFEKLLDKGEMYYYDMNDAPEYQFSTMKMAENFDYDRFLEIMKDTNDLLGGGSDYDVESLAVIFSRVPMTYEEAYAEYIDFTEKDKVTGGLARYFCDYAGIILTLLPVFVAASMTAADRKRRMHELVYTRNISSFKIVYTRYAALVVTMFIPVLIMMAAALIQALNIYGGENLSCLAMFTLPTFWLLPNILFAAALGMLVTEVFSSFTAIAVQVVVWFGSVMSGGRMLYGNIGKYDLLCRHNSSLGRSLFLSNWDNFVFSRIFWTVMSIVIVLLAVMAYDAKRGGKFNGIKLFGKGGLLRRKA